MLEGVSSNLQTFPFIISEDKDMSLLYKWSNINETENHLKIKRNVIY